MVRYRQVFIHGMNDRINICHFTCYIVTWSCARALQSTVHELFCLHCRGSAEIVWKTQWYVEIKILTALMKPSNAWFGCHCNFLMVSLLWWGNLPQWFYWCKNVWDVSKYLKNFELFYGDGIFSFLFFCAQLLAVLGVCSIDTEMEFSLSCYFVHNSWQY